MDEADLLPAEQFRLYAVAARFPRNLQEEGVPLHSVQEGSTRSRPWRGTSA
jgi:hypothetical protein